MGCLVSIPPPQKIRQSYRGFAVSPSKSMFPRWDTIRSLSGTLKLKGGNRAPLLAVTLRKLVRVSHFSSVWNLSYLSIALSFHSLGARTVNSLIHLTCPRIWVLPPVGFICFKVRTETIFLRHENIDGFFSGRFISFAPLTDTLKPKSLRNKLSYPVHLRFHQSKAPPDALTKFTQPLPHPSATPFCSIPSTSLQLLDLF